MLCRARHVAWCDVVGDGMCRTAQSNDIQKSFKDDREYRHIELGNKLRVMLVSDASADKASAAMCVKVGHFSDPEEFPGLAHFCEVRGCWRAVRHGLSALALV